MKLAEALLLRGEYQSKLEHLEERIRANLKIQEGDTPTENPQLLLQTARETSQALCSLVARINRTNHTLFLEEGVSLADALARRDMLRSQRQLLSRLAQEAAQRDYRLTHSEVRMVVTLDLGALQREIDQLSKEFRELDTRIQGLNWTCELLE